MRAISLWQPYAQLIVLGLKRVETRSWSTKVTGTIAIHAAKRRPDSVFAATEGKNLPLGAVVGTAELIGCFPIESLFGSEFDTPDERAYGDWTAGRFGWVLEKVEMLERPVPAKGKQGFWIWDESGEFLK